MWLTEVVFFANPMLPASLTLRGHVAWDKFILYIIYTSST